VARRTRARQRAELLAEGARVGSVPAEGPGDAAVDGRAGQARGPDGAGVLEQGHAGAGGDVEAEEHEWLAFLEGAAGRAETATAIADGEVAGGRTGAHPVVVDSPTEGDAAPGVAERRCATRVAEGGAEAAVADVALVAQGAELARGSGQACRAGATVGVEARAEVAGVGTRQADPLVGGARDLAGLKDGEVHRAAVGPGAGAGTARALLAAAREVVTFGVAFAGLQAGVALAFGRRAGQRDV
jgi:hypothetical protein